MYNGTELISLLNKIYKAFDEICADYQLQKIESVGKTYMISSCLNFSNEDRNEIHK